MAARDREIQHLREENLRLLEENLALRHQLREMQGLADLVQTLQARIRDLEAQLSLNSQNSSQPPSADKPGRKPKKKSKPKGKGRKRGAQPGHRGKNRDLVSPDRVDETLDHKPDKCSRCEAALSGEDPRPQRHQVAEIPETPAHVTEHRLHALKCHGCGKTTRAGLPEGVTWSAFGPRLTTLVGYYSGVCRQSARQIQTLLEDIHALPLSVGSVKNLEKRLSEALEPAVMQAKAYIKRQPVVHLDETGWRHENERAWLWTAVTSLMAVFVIDRSRGRKVARSLLGESFGGIGVSDRWSAYSYLSATWRQVCWAHLKRDFQAMAERGHRGAKVGKDLEKLRRELFKYWHRVRDGTLKRSSFQTYACRIRKEMKALLEKGARSSDKKIGSLCRGILEDEASMWTFVRREGVEPTNNAAERALRPAVIWRKVRFGTQSEWGRVCVERMLTVVGSLRLQGRRVMEFLTAAYQAHIAGEAGPSLLPLPITVENQAA